jgi:hypothetical protein
LVRGDCIQQRDACRGAGCWGGGTVFSREIPAEVLVVGEGGTVFSREIHAEVLVGEG